MAADKKSKTKKRWSMKQGKRVEKFILRHWWISVTSRVRADIVQDDSWSYAVFTEQGSSAPQIISGLPGCAGQAADAVSAYSQVEMEDAPTLLKIPKSECPDIWIRLPKHKWPKSWSSMEEPVVPLERNLYGHLLAGLLWERQFGKVLLEHGLEKFRIGNVYSLIEKKDYSCLYTWTM